MGLVRRLGIHAGGKIWLLGHTRQFRPVWSCNMAVE